MQVNSLRHINIFYKDKTMKQILLILTISLFITGCNEPTQTTTPAVCPIIDKGLDSMNKKEITDSIDAYNVALKDDNSTVDICMYAGKVKAAYERAKDHDNAEIWGGIEKSDCKNAGL